MNNQKTLLLKNGHRIVQGVNDLETTHPELIKEWDYEKNGELTPNMVSRGSGKKVWWICQNGHSYQATILHRTGENPTGCPVCNQGRQTSFREQALYFYVKKLYPNAINRYRADFLGKFELDIYIPEISTAIEYDGVAWHKMNKIEREQRKYALCHTHGIKLIRVKEKMYDQLGLDIADEQYSCGNVENRAEFEDLIHFVLSKICLKGPYMINPVDVNVERDRFKIIKTSDNLRHNLETEYPEVAKEWNFSKNNELKPSNVKPHSGFKAWWTCSACGYEYEAVINSRVSGCGCPKCANEKQIKTMRKNRIVKYGSITNELLLKEWNYEKNNGDLPENYTKSSQTKVWWKCSKCSYEWQAIISNRENGRGCPCCSNHVVVQGVNDLASQYPSIAAEWDYSKNVGLTPKDITGGHNGQVWWICPDCGNSYQAPPARRTSQGSGCRECGNKIRGKNAIKNKIMKQGSFGDNHPELLKELSPNNVIDPFSITSGSKEKLLWRCPVCGKEWLACPRQRIKGHGCYDCGQIKAREGHRKTSAAKRALKNK